MDPYLDQIKALTPTISAALDLALASDFDPEVMHQLSYSPLLRDESQIYIGDVSRKNVFAWHLAQKAPDKLLNWIESNLGGRQGWHNLVAQDLLEGAAVQLYLEGETKHVNRFFSKIGKLKNTPQDIDFNMLNMHLGPALSRMLGNEKKPEDDQKIKALADHFIEKKRMQRARIAELFVPQKKNKNVRLYPQQKS